MPNNTFGHLVQLKMMLAKLVILCCSPRMHACCVCNEICTAFDCILAYSYMLIAEVVFLMQHGMLVSKQTPLLSVMIGLPHVLKSCCSFARGTCGVGYAH